MMLVFVMVFAGLTWYRQRNNNAAEPTPVKNSQAQTAPAATTAVNAPGTQNAGQAAAGIQRQKPQRAGFRRNDDRH